MSYGSTLKVGQQSSYPLNLRGASGASYTFTVLYIEGDLIKAYQPPCND